MNTKKLIVTCVVLFATHSYGYEQTVHRDIAKAATGASVLSMPGYLRNFGMSPLQIDFPRRYSNSNGDLRSIADLIVDGAQFEDDGIRSMNHFFDPRSGLPLHFDTTSLTGIPSVFAVTVNAFATVSPDYALGISPGTPANDFSYRSAQDFLLTALTAPSAVTRREAFGLLFETLGRLVHHVQDMAQPQHVRNDPHMSDNGIDGKCAPPVSAALASLCEAYAALRSPSSYEAWTTVVKNELPMAGYAPVYTPGGDTATPFSLPRRFWSYDRKGLADYTNRNFLSAGTVDQAPPLLGPAYEVSMRDLCQDARPACGNIELSQHMLFWPSVVDDQLRGDVDTNPYAATASIFTEDVSNYAPDFRTLYGVNRFTYLYDHKYLLPRAVGYSAGLINYFLRGAMDIALPDEGVYGVLDHSTSACGLFCGFTKIKLKLRNTTSGNESMGAGVLWAVAKYRLNNCYRSDLSGEDGGNHFGGLSCRSVDEYVSVSRALEIGSIGNAIFTPLQFDFPGSSAIPVNASDLVLQVVFTGRLGEEREAIAVATRDIAEPTYFALFNVTDYIYDEADEQYHPYPYKNYRTGLDLIDAGMAFGSDADTRPPLAKMPRLGPGEHAQIALLMDRGPQPSFFRVTGEYANASDVALVPFDPAEFGVDDIDPAAGLYQRSCDVVPIRGLYGDRGRTFNQEVVLHRTGASLAQGNSGSPATTAINGSAVMPWSGTKAARRANCLHPRDPTGDFTLMTPLSPQAAKPWVIDF